MGSEAECRPAADDRHEQLGALPRRERDLAALHGSLEETAVARDLEHRETLEAQPVERARQVVGVGALQSGEGRTFTLAVDVFTASGIRPTPASNLATTPEPARRR